jgi:hypothetical protein
MSRTALVLASMLLSLPAHAVSYDEAVDGPLADTQLASTDLGALDDGTHTVTGTVSADMDALRFDLPPGHRVTSASVQVTGFAGAGRGYMRVANELLDSLGERSFGADGTYTVPGTPLDVGTWVWSIDTDNTRVSFSYVLTLEVEQFADCDLWSEADGGDLSNLDMLPTDLGALDDGVFTVCGRVDPARDAASFDLPSGVRLAAGRLEVFDFDSQGGDGFTRLLVGGTTASLGDRTFSADGTYTLPSTPVYGAGTWTLSTGSSRGGASFDYVATFEVERFANCDFWDEAIDGELGSISNGPVVLPRLSGRSVTICGRIDGDDDVGSFIVPPGGEVRAASLDVYGYDGGGFSEGVVRMASTNPAVGLGDRTFTADGSYTVPGTPVPDGTWTWTAAGLGGAAFDYVLTLTLGLPPEPELDVPNPVAGQQSSFFIRSTPGHQVFLAASPNQGSTPIPFCTGVSAGLQSPVLVGSGLVQPNGQLELTATIPPSLAGQTFYLQALDATTCMVTPVEPVTPQ